ncbi:MAG TPA: ferritin [Armatimonadota bacterium]|nr:ferritin [Armatimonadota bacterium]
MLSPKMQAALNDQINRELWSGYIYLSMAAYFEERNLAGAAHWMHAQFKEELFHMMKLYNFVVERGGRVLLQPVDAVETEWESALDAFAYGYNHETLVTASINSLVDLAVEEKDHATNSFLNWYVDEQVEEESSFDGVVQQLKLAGDGGGLFMVDKELGQRVELFTLPMGEAEGG